LGYPGAARLNPRRHPLTRWPTPVTTRAAAPARTSRRLRSHYGDGVPGPGRHLPLVAVLAVVGAGLALGAAGAWRPGAWVVGGGVVLAGVLRLVLPARRAGLLAARSRRADAVFLLGLGVALVALATSVPEP
jgi:hypothetical protein